MKIFKGIEKRIALQSIKKKELKKNRVRIKKTVYEQTWQYRFVPKVIFCTLSQKQDAFV